MIKFVVMALIWTVAVGAVHAAPQKYEKETKVSVSSNSKFTISAGWTFDDKSKKLTSPEGDLTAYLIEKKAEADLDALSLIHLLVFHSCYPILSSHRPPGSRTGLFDRRLKTLMRLQ